MDKSKKMTGFIVYALLHFWQSPLVLLMNNLISSPEQDAILQPKVTITNQMVRQNMMAFTTWNQSVKGFFFFVKKFISVEQHSSKAASLG